MKIKLSIDIDTEGSSTSQNATIMPKQPSKKKAKDFHDRLARTKAIAGGGGLESNVDTEVAPSFHESEVTERIEKTGHGLYKIIEEYLGNDPKLKKLADKILAEGGEPLRAVANLDEDYLNNNPGSRQLLEVIVQTDGSRPTFLIKNDQVDKKSSPLGDWNGELVASADDLKKAIRCVGRININQRHVGTGFLVARNLIITNRHVLQAVTENNNNSDNGPWVFKSGAHIDFGHEFRGQESVNPRALKKLIYCGPKFIDRDKVNHKKLDMAIIELEPVDDELIPLTILQWDDTKTWVKKGKKVWIIGYPGDPGMQGVADYSSSLLEKLFRSLYGYKRLAPGEIMGPVATGQPLTADHDATTLGGNSGSLVVVTGLETFASGLHYGGELDDPRQNWGHVLGIALEKISDTNKQVYDYLQQQVKFTS